MSPSRPTARVLVADYDNDRVRRVSPSGTISTLAGTGGAGYSGDGGPATSALLNGPYSIATKADGAFVIADAVNQRVRSVAPDGVITTLAGTGVPGDTGDGGPATAAQLHSPRGTAVAPDGSVLIADTSNHRVRRVSPAGTISTLAGTGVPGLAVDGGPAVSAQLKAPVDVAATAGGGVLIADYLNWRVRWVDVDLRAPTGGSGSAVPAPAAPAAPAPPKLAIALGFSRITMRAGRFVSVRFAATVPAAVTLKLRRNGHTLKTLTRAGHDGRNTIRVRMPKRTGRYTLDLRASSSDGQVATDRARVTLTRR